SVGGIQAEFILNWKANISSEYVIRGGVGVSRAGTFVYIGAYLNVVFDVSGQGSSPASIFLYIIGPGEVELLRCRYPGQACCPCEVEPLWLRIFWTRLEFYLSNRVTSGRETVLIHNKRISALLVRVGLCIN
ncbi:unnamed protein product, partial [Hapterophycus canaliculatus]